MSRVTIKTFTGRSEDYLTGQTAHFSEIQNRVADEDFAAVDQYYERVEKIPRAWKECWADVGENPYNRVVMLYDCNFITLRGEDEKQRWQAMTIFMNGSQIVNLLLISENELLDTLWQDHRPNFFEYGLRPTEPELRGSENGRTFLYHTVKGYLDRNNVQIMPQRLPTHQIVAGLNDGARYGESDDDIELLLMLISEALEIAQPVIPEPPEAPEEPGFEPPEMPEPGVLEPRHLDFFAGRPTEYVPPPTTPMPFRMRGKDFSAVDAYHEKCGRIPAAWHRLWTHLYRPNDAISSGRNYNRVIMLTKAKFTTVLEGESEETWHAAVVFLRNNEILNVLLVESTKLLFKLRFNHAPKNFEFTYSGVRGISYRPLSEYLNGDLTDGQKVEVELVDLSDNPDREIKFATSDEGVKVFGEVLKKLTQK